METEDSSPNKPSKPPYFFLIPVGIAVLGLVGYQTMRAGFDTQVHGSRYILDTNQDRTPITAHNQNDNSQVAVAAKPSPTPSPEPSATPSASPTPRTTPSAKVKPQHTAVASAGKTARLPGAARPRSASPVRLAFNNSGAQPPIAAAGPPGGGVQPVPPPVATAPPATEAPAPKVTETPANGPIDASDRVVDARMAYAAQPDYPPIAREEGLHGTAVVLVTVDPSGKILRTSIASSSGYAQLDNAARAAARSSTYLPPRVDGRPATETYRVVYDFSQ